MAKLSDVNQTPNPALDSLESLKRRYQRQNRELAKANANQAQQIQALQAELSHKNAENIRLGSEIISLQRELDARDSRGSSSSAGISEGTKRQLEDKLSELAELVRGLGDGGNLNSGGRRRLSGKRFPIATKPDVSQRERPDGILQDIPEYEAAGQVPTSPLFSAAKRNDARLESPAKSYIPLDSAMFDIRPRRRRDSTNVESLIASGSKTEEQQRSNAGAKEAVKRKYPDITEPIVAREEFEDRIAAPRLSDVNEVSLSPKPVTEDATTVPQPAEKLKEAKDSGAEATSRAPPSPYRVDLANASRFVTSNRRSLENVQELARAQAQAPEPAPVPAAEPRRALEPKSTNLVNMNNSPVKLPTIADFEYVKKEKPSPRDRDPVKKTSRIVGKPIVVQGAENTLTPEKAVERNRRTRGVTVNYALPALNKKLRRESETLVDAVTGIQPKRRSTSNFDDVSKDASAASTPANAVTSGAANTGIPHEGDKKSYKSTIEDLERRASRMSIHHDAPAGAEPVERKAAESGLSDRDLRKIIAERTSRERLEQARKDIYEFTTTNSPDAAEPPRKTSSDRHSLPASSSSNVAAAAANIGGSHQRRTSGGIPTIGIGSRREGESRASTSNLKSANDLLEERRRRRASLGGATSATVTSALEAKPRRTVGFADNVRDDGKNAASSRDSRRRSMVI
ncbi:hypothetical protein Dda_0480 [Drechslerella dactyloides]|uniref:Shugoshin C-terminal domain-containing protein n=1 Tax=Drechslerella dactyloides TaxID=74499 RepID=A0AAD6J4Z7_DREDA|nr:hypothetical protein Dda_0480 [Drechslerella dactyloides]